MKDLKPIRGRRYILDLISQGEHEQQDFKYAISDARKIARSISAFANNSGGHLFIGVKDNGVIAGVKNDEDIYVVEQAGWMYCDPPQDIEFTAFSTGESGVVIRARVSESTEKPVRVKEGENKMRAYYRVADENISAHPLMVRAWRHQAADSSELFNLDGVEREVLSAVGRTGYLDVNEALRIGTASRRTVEKAIVRLVAMQVLKFEYRAGRFMLKQE